MKLIVSGAMPTMERLAQLPESPAVLGHLWTPATANSLARQDRTGLEWACDNAAFGDQWSTEAFQAAVFDKIAVLTAGKGRPPLFVPAPDVVGDSKATAIMFEVWEPTLALAGVPLAFVAQDGAERQMLPWDRFSWLFVGGTRTYASGQWGEGPYTEWKESKAAADLIGEAKRRGKRVHVGRVNSLRRMKHFYDLQVDTVDGSSFSMFPDTYIPKFIEAISCWNNGRPTPTIKRVRKPKV